MENKCNIEIVVKAENVSEIASASVKKIEEITEEVLEAETKGIIVDKDTGAK